MNGNLLRYINEYFNTFKDEDYMIYVDGKLSKWHGFNRNWIIWNIPADSNGNDSSIVYSWEIKEISIMATTMVIKKINGEEHTFTAMGKTKEGKVKELILKMKNALSGERIDEALRYLNKMDMLINE